MVPLLRMAPPAKDRIPPTEWLTDSCKTSFAGDKIVGSCKGPWRVVRNVIFCHRVPLADPRSAGDVCPTLSPISFISMQFLAEILPSNRLAHPPLGWRTLLTEMLDPPVTVPLLSLSLHSLVVSDNARVMPFPKWFSEWKRTVAGWDKDDKWDFDVWAKTNANSCS